MTHMVNMIIFQSLPKLWCFVCADRNYGMWLTQTAWQQGYYPMGVQPLDQNQLDYHKPGVFSSQTLCTCQCESCRPHPQADPWNSDRDNLCPSVSTLPWTFTVRISSRKIKGVVHLNIIFSYMKVNKICNLDHPVY